VSRRLDGELARESVQARDPALEIAPGQAGVRGAGGAGRAFRARAANGRRDEVAGGKAVAAGDDLSEQLVPEHERPLVRRRDAEAPVRDPGTRPADADPER